MARGWESKSVEDQQQAAEERARQREAAPHDDSPQARARRERLEFLRLSRARTLEQLHCSRHVVEVAVPRVAVENHGDFHTARDPFRKSNAFRHR